VTPRAAATWTWPAARPASASERAIGSFGALCFMGFLVAQFVSLTRLFLIEHMGGVAAYVASQAGLLSVALLVPAVLSYGLRTGGLFCRLTAGARVWAGLVLALAVLLLLYGWIEKGYQLTAVLHDFAPYVVIVLCAALGSVSRAWEDVDGLLVALFVAALAVNALGMEGVTEVISERQSDDRAGVEVVGYRTQGALAFWPLLFLTARLRRRHVAVVAFAGVCFVVAQQILFQKRAPTLRIALFLLVFFVVLPRLPRARLAMPKGGEKWVRTAFGATALAGLLLAGTLAPWLFRGQLAGLRERISGERYGGGAAGMLTYQNERFYEVGMFMDTLEPQEWVLGRGFGGYFVPADPEWGVWLDDVREYGRRQLHVGGLMPFFKGGLVLALAYYSGLLMALVRGRRQFADPFAAAVFFVLALHAVFLVQEGWFVMSMSFDLAMVGLCMGYLLSRERDAMPGWEVGSAQP
jgi:hypothetical protein